MRSPSWVRPYFSYRARSVQAREKSCSGTSEKHCRVTCCDTATCPTRKRTNRVRRYCSNGPLPACGRSCPPPDTSPYRLCPAPAVPWWTGFGNGRFVRLARVLRGQIRQHHFPLTDHLGAFSDLFRGKGPVPAVVPQRQLACFSGLTLVARPKGLRLETRWAKLGSARACTFAQWTRPPGGGSVWKFVQKTHGMLPRSLAEIGKVTGSVVLPLPEEIACAAAMSTPGKQSSNWYNPPGGKCAGREASRPGNDPIPFRRSTTLRE